MFTGIIESLGELVESKADKENLLLTFRSNFTSELKIDQSVAHNGVCLTVIAIKDDTYTLCVIKESIDRSNLGELQIGDKVNLERCMPANGRFDGHIVQGHVDQTAEVTKVEALEGSWKYHFKYNTEEGNVTVEKGSITINGVSLTVIDSGKGTFSVGIIPYTFEHTNFHTFKPGTKVNLEFDILGKYVQRMLKGYSQGA